MSIQFNLPRHGFSLLDGKEAETEVRMLLPSLGQGVKTLVAVDGQHGLVVGAAAITAEFRAKEPVGPGIAIHVIPPCRRQGVGSVLLEELARIAKSQRAQALYTLNRIDAESETAQSCKWLGFEPAEQVQEHLLPFEGFEKILGPLHERMKQRGKIPAGARIIPLYAADQEAVIDLHLAHMGGDRETLRARIKGGVPGAFHPRYSRVLLLDDRVVGCLLARYESDKIAVADANIISPELRGGWANIWLKLETTRGAHSVGLDMFRFTTFDHYQDTRMLSKKLAGATIKTTVLMRRLLT